MRMSCDPSDAAVHSLTALGARPASFQAPRLPSDRIRAEWISSLTTKSAAPGGR
jgi:hypothetical protein